MSYSGSSQHTIRAHRDLSCILRMFSSAALLIAGMFFGRFLTKTGMQEAIVTWEAKLSALHAELASIRQLAAAPSPQQAALDRLTRQYQRLSERSSEQTSRIAAQGELIERALAAAAADRRSCLEELRRYEISGEALDAKNVLKFAMELFDSQNEVLTSLAAACSSTSPTNQTVPIPADNHSNAATLLEGLLVSDVRVSPSESRQAPAGVAIGPTIENRMTHVASSKGAETQPQRRSTEPTLDASFLDPPRPRRSGFTFITPRRTSRVASARQSGIIIFSD